MYFEFSTHKLMPLAALGAVLAAGVSAFVLLNNSLGVTDHVFESISRIESDIAYQWLYKNPNAAAVALGAPGPFAMPQGAARAVPVLLYHGAPPEGNGNPPLPQEVFVAQMQALKADGWQTITLEQFEAFMKKGTPLPAKSFLLTFDDGRKESFYPVDPVLKDLGFNAVMFVITGFSLPQKGAVSTFYLNKNELQYMVDSGRWELESHGDQDHRLYDVPGATAQDGVLPTLHQKHFLSNKFWLADKNRVETAAEYQRRITQDLRTSKQILEADFGKPVTAFAYPFNDYGQDTANYPAAIGDLSNVVTALYMFAFYQVDPGRDDPFNYPDASAYMVKRLEPTASLSGADLVRLLDTDAPKALPYRNSATWSEWTGNWGAVVAGPAGLSLAARSDTTGAAALINGSPWWQDYALAATVDWKRGSNVSLIARYQSDSKSFLSCAYSDTDIMLEAHEAGGQKTLAAGPYVLQNKRSAALSMSVAGDTATCSANGASVHAQVGAAFLHAGAAGLQVWDPALGVGSVTVQAASARQL